MNTVSDQTLPKPTKFLANVSSFLELCKPRVVALMILTAIVGMCMASPGKLHWHPLFFGTLGIALAAGSAAVVNHLIDRKIDALMFRTENRPIPTGNVSPKQALLFAAVLGTLGLSILVNYINVLTAILTFFTLMGYAVFYTVFLKHATPQNIVIGGIFGAMPPALGWSAVTNHIGPYSLLLVLIIFVWTPPHFWALAIHRLEEYSKAKVPMLPVTHGIPLTKLHILLYTILLFPCSILPYLTGMSGLLYVLAAIPLGLGFLYHSYLLYREETSKHALKTFIYSIYYLLLLFIALLVDHYFRISLLDGRF